MQIRDYGMARTTKTGLDYFPFDVDFFSDEKIGAISGEFGIKGEITVVKLLCAIYRNGYFILWDEALKMKLLSGLPGISIELLEKIVNRLVKWGFFEQDLFGTARVLSSKGIQRRYFEAVKRRKPISEYPYLLINVCNNRINVRNNRINVCNNQQRREDIKKPSKEGKESTVYVDIFSKPISDCHDELLSNIPWMEVVVMNKRASGHPDFTTDTFRKYLARFFDKLRNEGETDKPPKDAMSHFSRWLDIELCKKEDRYTAENESLLASSKEDGIYHRLLSYIKSNAPYCFSNMRMPTKDEAVILRDKYGNESFKDALRVIEGRTDIRTKWDVLYYAVLKQIEYKNGS